MTNPTVAHPQDGAGHRPDQGSALPPGAAASNEPVTMDLRPDRLPRDVGDPDRYGIYLRPDPRTCHAVTTVTAQLRAQYGFVSAGAFPPHATLVGSEHLGRSEDAIVDAVDAALVGVAGFEVHNSGVTTLGAGYVYDLHHLADGTTPNAALTDLAALVDSAITPLRRPSSSPAAVRFDPALFQAHASLASHDLLERPDLHEEVGQYITELDVQHPPSFDAAVVVLYRTSSADWSGRWWRTLTFEHLHSWRLYPTR